MTGQVKQFVRWTALAVTVVALPASAMAQAEQAPVTISGRVTSETGEPLRSANVSIFELGLMAQVGPDGNYRLVVPPARATGQQVVLRARMIGYQARGVPIALRPGATITQNFQLTADPLRLEEVVVTGAGTEALAERLGTVRASVDAPTITRANEVNVVAALVLVSWTYPRLVVWPLARDVVRLGVVAVVAFGVPALVLGDWPALGIALALYVGAVSFLLPEDRELGVRVVRSVLPG